MSNVVIPSECILLKSAFVNIAKDKLPKSSKALTLIGEEFVNYLVQAFDNKSPQINFIYQALANQKEKHKILDLMKEKASFSSKEEFAFTFINFCLLDELKVYQKANDISCLSRKEIYFNYTKVYYYTKLSWLDLTDRDKVTLNDSKVQLANELIKVIETTSLLLYENFKENQFDNFKQISLEKFKRYLENSLYIDFTTNKNIIISFENSDNDIIIYPTSSKSYIKKGNYIKYTKANKSQKRILYVVNNIHRRIAKQENRAELILNYQMCLKELEALEGLSLTSNMFNLEQQKTNLREQAQRLSFELAYLGLEKGVDNINKSLGVIKHKITKLNKKLSAVLDIQVKCNISGLSSVPVLQDIYTVEEGLRITKSDIHKLSKQKDKVFEYWLVTAAGNNVYYKNPKSEKIDTVQYKDLVKVVDNAYWIEPFLTKDFLVLFVFNKNEKREADLSKNPYYICFFNEDH